MGEPSSRASGVPLDPEWVPDWIPDGMRSWKQPEIGLTSRQSHSERPAPPPPPVPEADDEGFTRIEATVIVKPKANRRVHRHLHGIHLSASLHKCLLHNRPWSCKLRRACR